MRASSIVLTVAGVITFALRADGADIASTTDCQMTKCDASKNTPVCGSNGVTYANDCLFEFAKCQSETLMLLANTSCEKMKQDTTTSVTCDEFCTREFLQVCGSDGKTYNNKCLFEVAKCKEPNLTLVKEGPCSSD